MTQTETNALVERLANSLERSYLGCAHGLAIYYAHITIPIVLEREAAAHAAGELAGAKKAKRLRDAAMQHYMDWDDEPEDVVELREAIADFNRALELLEVLKP